MSPALTLAVLLLLVAEESQAVNTTKNCKLIAESQTERKVLDLLEPLTNKTFSVKTPADPESYTYQFRVCGSVGNQPDGGVVQKDESGKETLIGKYTATQAIGGSDWVMLIYKNGSAYDSHCGKENRKAIIMISCNRGVAAGELAVVLEERQKENDCFYLFELDSSAVCPAIPSKLSVGSVLLIVAFSCLAVYLIGGFLYQRLVVGAKGVEQFPNYFFWQEIGNLTADGCDFVCRSRGNREEPPTYRGVATEPLGEEPEERDDHLLPM